MNIKVADNVPRITGSNKATECKTLNVLRKDIARMKTVLAEREGGNK